MIRTNLSTRPFYNETAVTVWLLALAALVAAATAFNAQRLYQYSRTDTELAAQASGDERRAADLRADAKRLRASVNTEQMEASTTDAEQANDLISRRTFSWTELFNRIEATLPADVRVTSLRQNTNRDRTTVLNISIVAKNIDDVNRFMENLGETGAFSNMLAPEQQMDPDSGLLTVVLQGKYQPSNPAPAETAVSNVNNVKRPAR